MKNLFIITSCLFPKIGTPILPNERFEKTIESIESVRKKDPTAYIVLSDVSINPTTNEYKQTLVDLVDYYHDLSVYQKIKALSELGLKSASECCLMIETLDILKWTGKIDEMDRIFKLSGRIVLSPEFDINFYNDKQGKYVFKKKEESWRKDQHTHYLDTRLYSFCSSLYETHRQILQNSLSQILNRGLDIEHTFALQIPQDKLIEVDRVFCQGQPAGLNGEWKYD
jgi:hypothetical protein